MKLKYLEFVFENCDSIKIEGKYIGDFLVEDLKTSIKRIACNSIDKIEAANTIAIEIHKDANKERYQFDQKDTDKFKQMVFDRFREYNDITSIQFELEESYAKEGQPSYTEYYDYYVDWTGDNDYTNAAQKTYLSKAENLYIVIADGKKIEDFFDLDKIEDKKYMDFHFGMYDIGNDNNGTGKDEKVEEKENDITDNIPEELTDTVDMMNSDDWKERFKAEYYQTLIRYNKLQNIIDKRYTNNHDSTFNCLSNSYEEQLTAMDSYLTILEERAVAEKIKL